MISQSTNANHSGKPSPHAIIFAVVQVGLAKALIIPATVSFYTFQACNKANAWLCARSERNMDRFNRWLELK
jgi:hypothetical protein